jgi:chromosome segregation ATPase
MENLMKKLIILIILSWISLYADNDKLISKELVKTELTNILENVKKYKKKNDNTNKKLIEELNALKRKFNTYKIQQKSKIKSVTTQLHQAKKELIKNQKQLSNIQKKVTKIKKSEKDVKTQLQLTEQQLKKKRKELLTMKKKVVKIKKDEQKIILTSTIEELPLPLVNNASWVEIVVEDNINIYELALKYYGDKNKYQDIYVANQHIIGDNFQIHNGMSLKIPMTNKFEEQPMILNRD